MFFAACTPGAGGCDLQAAAERRASGCHGRERYRATPCPVLTRTALCCSERRVWSYCGGLTGGLGLRLGVLVCSGRARVLRQFSHKVRAFSVCRVAMRTHAHTRMQESAACHNLAHSNTSADTTAQHNKATPTQHTKHSNNNTATTTTTHDAPTTAR
eukprot:216530-Rhodomonas_salina.3